MAHEVRPDMLGGVREGGDRAGRHGDFAQREAAGAVLFVQTQSDAIGLSGLPIRACSVKRGADACAEGDWDLRRSIRMGEEVQVWNRATEEEA
jgi:hypothetical protein